MSGFSGNNSGISQLIHKWAQQDKAHGHRGNVRFDGRCLYSYAEQIARFYPDIKKTSEKLVVLSRNKYSSTTTAHQSCAWSATTHYFQVNYDGWTSELPHNWEKAKKIILAQQLATLKAECEALATKRNVSQQLSYIKGKALEILALYSRCFKPSEFPKRSPFTLAGLRILASVGILNESRRMIYIAKRFEPKLAEKIQAETARQLTVTANRKTWAERQVIRQAREEKLRAAQLDAWRKGGPFGNFYFLPIALRLSAAANEIETSRGARVPLQAALAFYERLKSPLPIEGFQIGDFTVRDAYGSNGTTIIRIGCHEIPMSEIERIREQLP